MNIAIGDNSCCVREIGARTVFVAYSGALSVDLSVDCLKLNIDVDT